MSNARLLAGLFAVFVAAACWVMARRGPWLDEFWSMWQGRHDLPLGEILRQRWLVDFNPPLFSLLHWALMPVIGDTVAVHRYVNLLALAAAAAFTWVAIRRSPRHENFMLAFAALALALPATLPSLAEMRSYFAQLCAHYVIVGAAVLIADAPEGTDLDGRVDKALAALVAGAIVVGINLHYLSALSICLLVGGLCALCLWRGQRRWAAALALTTLIGLIPVVAYLFAQLPFLVDSSQHYWVRGSFGVAVLWFAYLSVEVLFTNPIAALAALGVALATTRAGALATLRALSLRFSPPLPPARRRVALVLLAVLAAFCVALLAAHLRQPIVTRRYLGNFQIVAAGLVACVAADALSSRRWLMPAVFALAVVAVAHQVHKLSKDERWDAAANTVEALSRACAPSTVHAVIVPRAAASRNELDVFRWAYEQQAARIGVPIRPHQVGRDRWPPMTTGRCPDLLWVEYVDWEVLSRAASTRDLLRLIELDPATIDVAKARVVLSDTGFVMSVPR